MVSFINSEIPVRELAMPPFLPVKLYRGDQAMILVFGTLPTRLCQALREAGLLVGAVLDTRSFTKAGSIAGYDYLFVGWDRDRKRLFVRALRDCNRSGWLAREHGSPACAAPRPAGIADRALALSRPLETHDRGRAEL